MVICAIVYIGYGQFLFLNDSFFFYLSIAVLPVLLYLIAANNSVLLLYACVYKISLKYVVRKVRSITHFVSQINEKY